MQFIDLQIQYQKLKSDIDSNIQSVLDHSEFIMGKEVRELESELADYAGVRHCISCANGTDALLLSLLAYGIKEGDAVFVPTFTFYATAEAVSRCGATPVFVDIDKDTFNILAADLERAVRETAEKADLKPRVVIAVDLFGLPADYPEIERIAETYNLLVIEDAAQGFGGAIGGRKACSFGDIAATSFFPTKPLGCYGDGGAVFTNEDKVRDYVDSLRIHGRGSDKYDNIRTGMNSRLDTIQAAVLQVKLKVFQEYELEFRQKVAELYSRYLDGIVKTPDIPAGFASSFAQYSIRFKREEDRDRIQQILKEQGIPTMIYYRKSMHQQTVYRNNSSIYRGFDNANEVSRTILNLPMNPYLSEAEILQCTNAIKKALEEI